VLEVTLDELDCLLFPQNPRTIPSDRPDDPTGTVTLGGTLSQFGEQPADLELLSRRVATELSLKVLPGHLDETHHYTSVERLDLLNHPSGDYVSVRRLRGFNATDSLSHSLVYVENSENKFTFHDMRIVAKDSSTQRDLVVEPLEQPDKKLFTHAFRIYFSKPLEPNENFDIVYSLRAPGELEWLDSEKEMMSISLVRARRGVDSLRFEVALDFYPRAVGLMCTDRQGRRVSCIGNAPTVQSFVPRTWYEKLFNIEWKGGPYIVGFQREKPGDGLYMLEYLR
jgi:hypothetical protein